MAVQDSLIYLRLLVTVSCMLPRCIQARVYCFAYMSLRGSVSVLLVALGLHLLLERTPTNATYSNLARYRPGPTKAWSGYLQACGHCFG